MNIIFSINDIAAVAAQFWTKYADEKIFAFHGQMGAGKTTFIHALCDAKKVSSTVSSPTYSIINQYNYTHGNLYHIDLYRLNDEEEAIRSGVEDALYSGDICLVEWPEKTPHLFPADTVHVYITHIDAHTRNMRTAQ